MRTIVMTGGTSGFGAIAAARIAAAPDTRLLLGARGSAPDGIDTLPLDLSSLASVRGFAASVIERLAGTEIDGLVLNAGVVHPHADARTEDGYEHTFAVNHLAHYLLTRSLLDHLAHGAVVVCTTSGTHDPHENTSFPPPRHADAYLLAYPERDPGRDHQRLLAGKRAYTASKLCNILTVRALAAVSEARARQPVGIAFCPGQTPGTRLVRDLSVPLRAAWWLFGGPLGALMPQFNRREQAGRTLADLALGVARPPAGACYAALRRGELTWREPSQLALRDDVLFALWHSSAELAGLDSNRTSAELQPLIDVLEGRWACHVRHAPSPQMPSGAISFGWEECCVGPGGASILFDTRADGETGSFGGAGFITWDAAQNAYLLYSLTSASPEPGLFTGRWHDGSVVFDGYEYIAGRRFTARHSITDISPDGFVYTVEIGSASNNLARTAAIQYTRASAGPPTPPSSPDGWRTRGPARTPGRRRSAVRPAR